MGSPKPPSWCFAVRGAGCFAWTEVPFEEFSFSSAISACQKCGRWQDALHLLDTMLLGAKEVPLV